MRSTGVSYEFDRLPSILTTAVAVVLHFGQGKLGWVERYRATCEIRVETFLRSSTSTRMDPAKSYFQYESNAHLLVAGEDAADFLQSQFTNDLRPFEAGRCTYGLWLDVKGKVLGDSILLSEGEERFRILSERSNEERICSHLEKHIIADDVVIEVCPSVKVFEFLQVAVGALDWELPEFGHSLENEFGLFAQVRPGIFQLIVREEDKLEAVELDLEQAGLYGQDARERGLIRIGIGLPQVPEEIGEGDLPGEGELESDAISFTKGCYLGQEVVARMHNIGKPQRRLFELSGPGEVPPLPLILYNSEMKQIGELRTAYADGDAWRGVGILKTRFSQVGECLQNKTIQATVIKPLREGGHDE